MVTREHVLCGLLWLLSCDFLHFVHSTLILEILEPVVVVKEKESRQLELITITCNHSTGHDVRVYRQSIYPTSPCGNCFPIWPCSSDFCVMYTPSVGTLNYLSATQYTMVVACTDDHGEPETRTVEVRLQPNSPPAFTSRYSLCTVSDTKLVGIGNETCNATASDEDGDGIFYTMTSSPASNRFEIGYGSGIIRATTDLRVQCDPTVTFYVYASDQYNPVVGPSVITVTFNESNLRPVVTNLNTTIQIAENEAPQTVIIPISVTDADKYSAITYIMRATPEEGLDYYSVDTNGKVTTRKVLDYEYTPLRTVTLYFDISDGFCKAPPSWLTIQITDVNELPKLIPNYLEIKVYEGFVNFDPVWKVVDPDENEFHKWSRISNKNDFNVDDETGSIFSEEEIDIDPNKISKTHLLSVKVTDKDGRSTDGEVNITILDRNDNEPIFDKKVFDVSANECTDPGTILGQVTATDLDSSFQGNDHLFYTGTGKYIRVLSDGSIVLTSHCTAGISDDTLAHVTDQGQYPGPLTGVPATVTFSCATCPTPPELITTTTTATTSTTDTVSIYPSNTRNGFLDNLAWLIPAILLGVVLLSTLLYMLWRYCSAACTRWRLRRELLKKSPKVRNVNVEPNVKPKTSVAKKEELPPPPEPPQLPEEPFLFGFWKETYTDRNQRHAPSHNLLPASVAKDNEVAAIVLKEELAEKEAIAKERQEKIAEYEKQVDEYNKKINGVETEPSPKPPKRQVCNIL